MQLKDSDDKEPLDALQTATLQIRDAIVRREPFETLMSAKIRAETGVAIYQMDINGNVYKAPTSSDSRLASRELLYEMMLLVSAERHVLLERQFKRKITQLRAVWEKTLSNLDYEMKHASRDTGVADGIDDTKGKALEEIDKTKVHIIDHVREIFEDATEKMVTTSPRTEEGFFSDRTIYRINVRLDKPYKVATDHDHWDRISDIYDHLLSFLKSLTGMGPNPEESPDGLFGELREESLGLIRATQEEDKKGFKKLSKEDEDWNSRRKGNLWWLETDDEEELDILWVQPLSREFRIVVERWTGIVSQEIIQKQIDRLQVAFISAAERNQSRAQDRADELAKLKKLLDELKEYTP